MNCLFCQSKVVIDQNICQCKAIIYWNSTNISLSDYENYKYMFTIFTESLNKNRNTSISNKIEGCFFRIYNKDLQRLYGCSPLFVEYEYNYAPTIDPNNIEKSIETFLDRYFKLRAFQ